MRRVHAGDRTRPLGPRVIVGSGREYSLAAQRPRRLGSPLQNDGEHVAEALIELRYPKRCAGPFLGQGPVLSPLRLALEPYWRV